MCVFYRKMVGTVLTGAGKVEDEPAAIALHVQAVLATFCLTSVGFSSALQKAKFGGKVTQQQFKDCQRFSVA